MHLRSEELVYNPSSHNGALVNSFERLKLTSRLRRTYQQTVNSRKSSPGENRREHPTHRRVPKNPLRSLPPALAVSFISEAVRFRRTFKPLRTASELPEAPVCLRAHFSEPRRVPIDVHLNNGGAYWLVSEPPFLGVSFPYDVSKPWVATNTGIA